MSNQISPIEQWHQIVKSGNMAMLEEILADNVVFHSPVVWTPQEGKFITKMYLAAASKVLGEGQFTYTREIISENHACLEFKTKIGEVIVNGIDLIEWNENGKIVDFKVMIRPLQGMQAVHQKMGEMLKEMKKRTK